MNFSIDDDVLILETKRFRLFLWDPFIPDLWEYFIGETETGRWYCVGPIDFNIRPKAAQ